MPRQILATITVAQAEAYLEMNLLFRESFNIEQGLDRRLMSLSRSIKKSLAHAKKFPIS